MALTFVKAKLINPANQRQFTLLRLALDPMLDPFRREIKPPPMVLGAMRRDK